MTDIEILSSLYGMTEYTNPETVIFKTLASRYVYEHMIDSGRLGARVYDPVTGVDTFHENPGYLNYIMRRTSGFVGLGLLQGKAVQEEYERQASGGRLEHLPTLKGFHLAKGIDDE